MEATASNLKHVNNAIKRKFALVGLAKSEGCFFVFSDDDAMANKLAGLPTTTIYVCYLNHLTVDEWVRLVGEIVAEAETQYLEDNTPIVEMVTKAYKTRVLIRQTE